MTKLPSKYSAWLFIPCALLTLPIWIVFGSVFTPQYEIWQHLWQTVLSDYVINSIVLASAVGFGTLLIGTSLAWCIARYEFFGRKWLQWIVLLPLAMPAYIIAYTYTGLLDFAGPVQSAIRESYDLSYGEYWFPDIRSLPGAIIVMTLVLYPYVYILARTAFSEHPVSLREAGKSLGVSPHRYFLKVTWPLARPAILMGVALAMMEAFADYGTVQFFGVDTFTTGIFRTWFGLGNQIAASQLAALLCTFVLVLLLLEKWSRKQVRYFQNRQSGQRSPRQKLGTLSSLTLCIVCSLAPTLGFFVPVYQLGDWAFFVSTSSFDSDFFSLAWHSFSLAAISALVVVLLALFFAYGKRLNPGKLMFAQVQAVSMGYAIPGTVIAVGILLPLSWADHSINYVTDTFFAFTPGLILSGTAFALVLAYCVRFMSVALQNIETGLSRITPNMDEAARSLGSDKNQVLRAVHVPILKGSILSAVLLVFVDVLKELPATLILRPFNFDTLAVSAYQFASDERLVDAAAPALAIVLTGIIPVILLTRALDGKVE